MHHRNAFTLVELSIVLVILGLLVGGVLAGQSLIRAAELRTVGNERAGFAVALNAFREKYLAKPGDMNNATMFWGKDNVECTGDTGTTAVPGTCNGNGDGILQWGALEKFRFWQHLSLAGLIEGNWPGIPDASSSGDVLGVTSPKSRLSGGGWGAGNIEMFWGGDANTFAFDYGNYIIFGSQVANDDPIAGVITPAEAWGVDTKFDDGKPARGKMVVGGSRGTCTDSSSATDYDSDYTLSSDTKACLFNWPNSF